MIAAPFSAGCPSALDRVVWFALERFRLDAIAWPPPGWLAWALIGPAVLVTTAALWAWSGRRRNAAVAIALGALVVHPPILLSLAGLLARPSSERRRLGRADWLRVALLGVGAAAVLLALTTRCARQTELDALVLLDGTIATFRTGTGAIAAVLALFEGIRSPRAPHTTAAWLTVLCSLIAVALCHSYDARVTLVPAVVSVWWLAGRGGAALIAARSTLPARAGAMTVLALVPLLQAWTVAATPRERSPESAATARLAADALERMWRPAAVVAEDAAHDRFVTLWAAGEDQRRTTPLVVVPEDAVLARVAPGALYAFAHGARRLQLRGTVVAPVRSLAAGPPILWRALAAEPCVRVTPQWRDVTSLAVHGQISGVFERGATGRHAILYAALPSDVQIAPVNWPEIARPGLRLNGFTLADAQSREQYYRAALADDMPLTLIPRETAVVARVLLGRMERTPGALAVAFDTIPQRIVARLDAGTQTDRLDLCPSSEDLPVVGYPEAPAVAPIPIMSPAVVGRGWHQQERTGDFRFRWTAAPAADLRFIALGPAHLSFSVQVAAAQGEIRDAAAVLLNGVAATCEPRGGRCSWRLPVDALKIGLNHVTVQAPVSDPPDPRGLQVTGAELQSSS